MADKRITADELNQAMKPILSGDSERVEIDRFEILLYPEGTPSNPNEIRIVLADGYASHQGFARYGYDTFSKLLAAINEAL